MGSRNQDVLRTATRTILSQFVLDAADEVQDVYHLSIRGHNEMSLISFLMQTEEQYAATLIAAELVRFIDGKDGLFVKASRRDGWDQWLETDDLAYNHGFGHDVAEMSHCKVCLAGFTRRKLHPRNRHNSASVSRS